MKKIFAFSIMIVLAAIVAGIIFFSFEREIKIVPKIKPNEIIQELIEKKEQETKNEEKKNELSTSTINPQELLQELAKKNQENEKEGSVSCEKQNKKGELSVRIKEFFLRAEINLEIEGEKEKKCLVLIGVDKIIEFKKDEKPVTKEDFERLRNFLEGKKAEVSISKWQLEEILRKMENKEELIF
jgi:hypothetical protein